MTTKINPLPSGSLSFQKTVHTIRLDCLSYFLSKKRNRPHK